jgi:glucose dehydrogenase
MVIVNQIMNVGATTGFAWQWLGVALIIGGIVLIILGGSFGRT